MRVLRGLTPAPPLDDPLMAVFDALCRSSRWRDLRRRSGLRRELFTAASWHDLSVLADELRLAAGPGAFRVVLDDIDPEHPGAGRLVRDLGQLLATGRPAGRLVINPVRPGSDRKLVTRQRWAPPRQDLHQFLTSSPDSRDPDGDEVLEAAQRARVARHPDADSWAALAALVMGWRGRFDKVETWLAHPSTTGSELFGYVREECDRARTGDLGECRAPVPDRRPTLLRSSLGIFTTHDRLRGELEEVTADRAADPDRLRVLLSDAAEHDAVLLWCAAAAAARRRGMAAGPAPTCDDSRNAVESALLASLSVGCSTATVARILCLSTRAVEGRITALYRDVGCSSRAVLVRSFLSGGLRHR